MATVQYRVFTLRADIYLVGNADSGFEFKIGFNVEFNPLE